jgi:acetolactate decarboxylase
MCSQSEKRKPMLKTNISQTKFAILFLMLFTSCFDSKINQSFQVEYKGALKNIMHKGDLTAKVDLSEFSSVENFYALGAVENLKGEIQIFNSKPYNSFVEEDSLKFDTSYSKRATLLVYASVKDWVSLKLPDNINSEKELETYIKKVANENNIDTNQPFPFRIEGKMKEVQWHVINWKEGDLEHSHDKHISSGLNGNIKNIDVELLGFYSNAHHTIFTHHTTNMHMHVKLRNGEVAGHLDEFELGDSMILNLPKN